ncbi:Rec8 like protein-domain-containing protein [Trichophaea hybrida]|nr:Rec8 like protein-domain-containing protein [Trichophaea hybrida]
MKRVVKIDIGTPGSITLVLQAVLPYLLFTGREGVDDGCDEMEVVVRGGTNVPNSSGVDYFEQVLFPVLDEKVLPKGCAGRLKISVEKRCWGSSKGSQLANEQRVFQEYLIEALGKEDWKMKDVKIGIFLNEDSGGGPKNFLLLVASTENGFRLGRDVLYDSGQHRRSNLKDRSKMEYMVEACIGHLQRELAHECCVDEFLEDQVVVFQALAEGESRVDGGRTEEGEARQGSLYTRTARWVVEELCSKAEKGVAAACCRPAKTMFYSHEVLTQRKYGVATIWLVATLGLSRTALRKIGRKDILSVNVPKACDTVTNPAAPLALRLQSNLLVGISRVYGQQFEYFYHDVTNAHTSIKKLDMVNKQANIDIARGGEGRSDQLILMDDPNLHPDLLPELDLAILGDLSLEDLDNGSLTDLADSIERGGLTPQNHLPFSPELGTSPGTTGGYSEGFRPRSAVQDDRETPMPGDGEDNLQLEEHPLFEFDEQGEIREVSPELPPLFPDLNRTPIAAPGSRARPPRVPGSHLESEDVEEQVRREHEEGELPDLEGNQPGDDDLFPNFPQQMDLDGDFQPPGEPETSELTPLPLEGQFREEQAAAAAARGPRDSRENHITIDEDTQLTNHALKALHTNYLENMEIARREKVARRIQRAAKSNAHILVMQYGIGGELQNPILKELFSGQAILNAIQGMGGEDAEAAKKRKRAELRQDGEASDHEEARRTRAKTQEQEQAQNELGRGAVDLPGDLDMELGRDVPIDVGGDEVQSLHSDMPWSVGDQLFSGGVATSSVGGPRSVADSPIKPRNLHAMSRVSVAGSVMSVLEDVAEEGETNLGLDDTADQFEFFGPGAEVETQDANTQWVRETMERESFEFYEYDHRLEFLKKRILEEHEKREIETDINFITFQALIEPGRNRKIVAAQAFSHTLLLVTKGLVTVSQEHPFRTIQINAV